MSKTFTSQAAAFAAATLITLGLFSGTDAIAGHQARLVSGEEGTAAMQVAQVQYVTIAGHRTGV